MAGQPKPAFYAAVVLVVLGLIGFAFYRAADILAPQAPPGDGVAVPVPVGPGEGPAAPITNATQVEDQNTAGITTVDEYKFVPAQKLAPVKGASDYKKLDDHTVRFALNVWAGWAPIVWANGGHKAGKAWKTPTGEEFKVELVLIDSPAAMQDSFVSGSVHLGWGTLDMLPLFMERLVDDQGKPTDSRVMPRVFQQIDWSNGGDGIVVRSDIKEVRDLRGKKVVLAQNSPSHYFLLNMLVAGGVQPSEVQFIFTDDAFQAAAAFNSQKDIAACVSWAPDIYKLEAVPGNKMLVSTGTANRLIADVWYARADFARDNPGIIESLVRGIFDAAVELKKQEVKQQCAKQLADFYNLGEEDAINMFADAFNTGWGDNYQFFLNKNYLANFERVWNNSYYLYRRIGVLTKPRTPFDQVMDFTYIQKLGLEEKYKQQISQRPTFDARYVSEGEVAEKAFLTTTHYIHFFPNSSQVRKTILRKDDNGKDVEELYDPSIDVVLEKIGERIGQFELSRIVIEGHCDGSMKGQVDELLVNELSQSRANSVKDELVKKYDLDPNRFTVVGKGWSQPADASDAENHAKNRRVEVRILPAEGQ